jgi:hypothetical protein
MATSYKRYETYQMNTRNIHSDSPRIALLERGVLEDWEYMKLLTDRERIVLQKALTRDESRFRYNNDEIARMIGQKAGEVERIITSLVSVDTEHAGFISTDGVRIRSDSEQFAAIERARSSGFSPAELSCLTDRKKAYLLAITMPDPLDNRYSSLREAGTISEISGPQIISECFSHMQNVGNLLIIYQNIKTILQRHELVGAKTWEMDVMNFFCEAVENGYPLRGDKGGVFSTTLISRMIAERYQHSLKPHDVPNFFKQTIKKYLKKTKL